MAFLGMFHNLERQRSVLVVDDSSADVERVRRVLCNEYNVEVLNDGAAALERLSSGNIPDLLLVDWIMPGISGIEVCRYVRSAKGKLATVPLILLTAQNGSEEIIHALNSGANDYVSKPFVDEELRARVKTLISSKALLERAENAETELRHLLMSTPDPTFAIDRNENVTFANEGAVQVLGGSLESILGQNFRSLVPGFNLAHLNLRSPHPLPIPDLQINERLYSPSIRILPSDIFASTTISLRDVTDRRNDEARRLDFYSVIAHDLRTPITSILMRIQLAARGKHGVLSPGLLEDLKKIEASLRSQVGMVNDFLELAKLEGVGYKLERKPVCMVDLISETMEDFQPLLDRGNIEWKQEAGAEKIFAIGDRQRLKQVLANLIGNAIKFTPGPGYIVTSVSVTEHYIETSITDTGRGIAAEELPHIFQRFTRARESRNETVGTGLGLMIVREIVEAHAGKIHVSSQQGSGSTFSFCLPRVL